MKELNEFQNVDFEEKVKAQKGAKVEGPRHERQEVPRHEEQKGPRLEEKINFIISVSTDKKQLLELKKILVELEFNNADKKEGKEMIKDDKRKIRKR